MRPNLDSPILLRRQAPYPNLRSNEAIHAHPGVAALLSEAGLDPENPFGTWIQPGMNVLIKPNWVRHAAEGWASMEALTTHPSIIRPVVEFAARALRTPGGDYDGELILADAPLQSTDFHRLLSQNGIPPLLELWRSMGLPLTLADLRSVISATDESAF